MDRPAHPASERPLNLSSARLYGRFEIQPRVRSAGPAPGVCRGGQTESWGRVGSGQSTWKNLPRGWSRRS